MKFSTYTSSIIYCVIVLLVETSCYKSLHTAPIGNTYGAEFWTSQAAVEQGTLAMYGMLRTDLRTPIASGSGGEGPHFIYGDLPASVFVPNAPELQGIAKSPFNFSALNYWGVLANWTRFYQLIAQCNLILENVPQMSPDLFSSQNVKDAYIGEALFIRAYTYFYMTRIWGDPVYVTSTYNDVDYGNVPPIPRTPEGQVLDSCLRDLRIASKSLNFAKGDISKCLRANRGSVYSLMAHMFEWTHQYDSAHYYCQQVIDNGGYSLEPMETYKNIWKGLSSNESIWEISMTYQASDPNLNAGSNITDWTESQFSFFATFLKGPIVNNKKTSCWIAPVGSLIDNELFGNEDDARFNSILTYTSASGTVSNTNPNGYMLTKYTNYSYTQGQDIISNNLVLFRLSDIYLLNAEALAYLGNTSEASGNLAKTEDRAGINNYENLHVDANALLDEIVMERGRELIGEGQWFYDLIRTNKTQGWLQYMGYTENRVGLQGYYWPLDMQNLLPYDPLLTQNPYWVSNNTGL